MLYIVPNSNLDRWKTEILGNESHESKERTETWPQVEFVTTKGELGTSRISRSIIDISTEFLRVVWADQSGRVPLLLEQPRGDIHGAGRVSSLSYVCHASRRGPQMPQMQKHRFAWYYPSEERYLLQENKEELAIGVLRISASPPTHPPHHLPSFCNASSTIGAPFPV